MRAIHLMCSQTHVAKITVYFTTFALSVLFRVTARESLPVGDRLDAQFFYIIPLFQSSTCFEQTRAHHQEVNCINL